MSSYSDPNESHNPKGVTADISDDVLRALYIDDGLTAREIAQRYGVGSETIRRRLIAAGIPRRPRGQPEGKYLPNGGRTVDKSGYVLVKAYGHPHANNSGYVREHRLVMEQVLGRYLLPEEVVHHINGIKDDNHPENLGLYDSNAAHKADDMLGNQWAKGDVGNPKRSRRAFRSRPQILESLRELAASLSRPVRRVDLQPPWPSYRTVARAFGSWQEGLGLALSDDFPTAEGTDSPPPEPGEGPEGGSPQAVIQLLPTRERNDGGIEPGIPSGREAA